MNKPIICRPKRDSYTFSISRSGSLECHPVSESPRNNTRSKKRKEKELAHNLSLHRWQTSPDQRGGVSLLPRANRNSSPSSIFKPTPHTSPVSPLNYILMEGKHESSHSFTLVYCTRRSLQKKKKGTRSSRGSSFFFFGGCLSKGGELRFKEDCMITVRIAQESYHSLLSS